ncbi:MAG: FprA family A-type flavoprotein [Spirochaetaceae bacterium]|nr:FprA family A-type flavoprotein [Spirochaetaceae bacterium]MDT8297230.1 FprA family A-type flavoprotein [Spirochaetaceae bacterium]
MIQDKIQITDGVFLVGKNDDRDVPFHRLMLTKGTTYNSYLVQADRLAVIDTVDISFGREYVQALGEHIVLESIDYIVINHVEPDHSGGLPALAAKAKNARIVCTEYARYELQRMYNLYTREFLIVKDGDSLDLGGKTLRFFETPWLHTEETMVTYLEENRVLFPCDIFSTHLANKTTFEDSAGYDITEDFQVYYQLIMHPHRRHVRDMLAKIADLDIQIIAPSHGFVLREDPRRFIDMYEKASRETPEPQKAAILYASMTGNTRKIARGLADGLEKDGIQVDIFDMNKADDESIIAAVQESNLVLVGTATKYADAIGRTEEVVGKLANLDLSGITAGAFGSYGWSGEGIEHLHDFLAATNMTLLESSTIIKTTGVTDVQFPLRMRFLPEDEADRIIDRTANFLAGILLDRKEDAA